MAQVVDTSELHEFLDEIEAREYVIPNLNDLIHNS